MAKPVGLPPKKNAKPAQALKQVHWNKIAEKDIMKTCWKEFVKKDDIKVNTKGLLDIFQKKKTEKKSGVTGKSPKKPTKKKKEEVKLIDPKRAYGIDIVLCRFKMSHTEIRNAIERFDESIMTPEVTGQLMNVVPNNEELQIVNDYLSDPSSTAALLDNCGKFFFVLSDLTGTPDLPTRMAFVQFKQTFHDQTAELQSSLELVLSVCEALKKSSALKTTLHVILSIGNQLNTGSKNGGAYGFKLNSLGKLRSTKGTDGTNLLEFIVQYTKKSHPKAATFVDELKDVGLAKRVESGITQAGVNKVKATLRKLEGVLQKETQWKSKDKFKTIMTAFSKVATSQVDKLSKLYEEAKTKATELNEWYGENKTLKWEDLFAKFDDFVTHWKNTEQHIQRMEEKKLAESKRLANQEAMKKLKGKSSKNLNAVGNTVGRGARGGSVVGPEQLREMGQINAARALKQHMAGEQEAASGSARGAAAFAKNKGKRKGRMGRMLKNIRQQSLRREGSGKGKANKLVVGQAANKRPLIPPKRSGGGKEQPPIPSKLGSTGAPKRASSRSVIVAATSRSPRSSTRALH